MLLFIDLVVLLKDTSSETPVLRPPLLFLFMVGLFFSFFLSLFPSLFLMEIQWI